MKAISWSIIITLGIVLLGCIACVAFLLYEFRERRVIIPVATNSPLTKKEAIDFSCLAIQQLGENTNGLSPWAYNGKDFLARQPDTPYGGYVIWAGTGSHPGYCVRLEQRHGEIRCLVARGK